MVTAARTKVPYFHAINEAVPLPVIDYHRTIGVSTAGRLRRRNAAGFADLKKYAALFFNPVSSEPNQEMLLTGYWYRESNSGYI